MLVVSVITIFNFHHEYFENLLVNMVAGHRAVNMVDGHRAVVLLQILETSMCTGGAAKF